MSIQRMSFIPYLPGSQELAPFNFTSFSLADHTSLSVLLCITGYYIFYIRAITDTVLYLATFDGIAFISYRLKYIYIQTNSSSAAQRNQSESDTWQHSYSFILFYYF